MVSFLNVRSYVSLALVLALGFGCSKDDHILGPEASGTVSTPATPSGNADGLSGETATYTTGGSVCSHGDGVEYRFDFDADLAHIYSAWGPSQQSHTWLKRAVGSYRVVAQARCKLHPNQLSSWSPPLTVTFAGETISVPSTPFGSTASIQGQLDVYQTGGAISSVPDTLEYHFDFDAAGTHEYSAWSLASQAARTWSAPGTFLVRAQARSIHRQHVVSDWSSALSVHVAPYETISTPSAPVGADAASTGDVKSYTTENAVSSLGHSLEYRFLVHDLTGDEPELDSYSNWSSAPSMQRNWDAAGTYSVKAQVRCSFHTQVVSFWSEELRVTVNPTGAIVITSASLHLTSTSEYSLVPLTLHVVNGPWSEASLTWESMPSVSDSIAGSRYEHACNDDVCYPITAFPIPADLLQSWLHHSADNHRLAIKPGFSASEDIYFTDRRAPYAPPYVHVTWHYDGEALQRTRDVAFSQDVWVDEAQPTMNHESIEALVAGRRSGKEQVIFVEFDLSLLPSSTPLLNAPAPAPIPISRGK